MRSGWRRTCARRRRCKTSPRFFDETRLVFAAAFLLAGRAAGLVPASVDFDSDVAFPLVSAATPAGPWRESRPSPAAKSAILPAIFLLPGFKIPFPQPSREAVREEQGRKGTRSAASRNEEQHVIAGLQSRLQAVEVLHRSKRMLINA